MKGIKFKWLTFVFVLSLVAIGCSNGTTDVADNDNSSEESESEAIEGGEIRIAFPSQPPTLDPHITTSSPTRDVSRHIFETLVTLNAQYEAVPMLAESVDQSEDNQTYTFHLREGVKFHNGETMTAEDVAASMNRWLDQSSSAKMLLGDATFNVIDEQTVALELEEPSSLALTALAASTQFAAIMPKEVIDAASETGVEEYIGTGPFQFNEWKQDQYIHLTKYEDYQAVDAPAEGIAGKKEALVDDVYFEIVGDPSTRIAGVQSGEYDIGMYLPHENYEQLKDTTDLRVDADIAGDLDLVLNKNEGVFADVKMRQAINAALDFDEILIGAFFDEDLYRLESSYMFREQVDWYSDAGKEYYNQNDLEKAKQLIEEAGYDGEEIKILATREYLFNYNAAVIVHEELKNLGLNAELEIYDWTTIVDLREDPKTWDLLFTGYPIVSTPVELVFYNPEYFDGPVDEKTTELLNAIRTAESQEEAKEHWDELQEHSWQFLPYIKIGDYTDINAISNSLEGYSYFEGPVLWNTKVTE